MSLDQCRRTIDSISEARDAIQSAVADGQWMEGQTRALLVDAFDLVSRVEHCAIRELNEIERTRVCERKEGAA